MTQQILLFGLCAHYDYYDLYFCIKSMTCNYIDYLQTLKCCSAIHDYKTEISILKTH
jgi:hypothetical protein